MVAEPLLSKVKFIVIHLQQGVYIDTKNQPVLFAVMSTRDDDRGWKKLHSVPIKIVEPFISSTDEIIPIKAEFDTFHSLQ
jgi:hypothetical protein